MSLDAALAQHRAGKLSEAERLYRQLLAREPRHARAMQLLGVLYLQRRQIDAAIEIIRHAIAIDPTPADFHSNLGNALMEKGLVDEAIEAYRRAVTIRPDYAEAHSNLANALCLRKKFDEAISHSGMALKLKPDYPEAHNNLGNALWGKGLVDEAIAQFRQAILVAPGYVSAHHNLSGALRGRGMMEEAMIECREAMRLWPQFPDAHYQHAVLLLVDKRLAEAIVEFQEAIRLKPDFGEAWYNLAAALHIQGKMDEALAACEQALKIAPNLGEAHMCMANLLSEMGRIDGAVSGCQSAMKFLPDHSEAHGNLIYFTQMLEGADAMTLKDASVRWAGKFSAGVRPLARPQNTDLSPDRRLKIGFVSPDFCDHPAGRFFLSLVEKLDPQRLEIFCYWNGYAADRITTRIQEKSHQWRSVAGLNDDEAASRIHADQIDILVDLALHTAANRLTVFTRKPAPVQATWLGYPGTTGLRQIDYRLTDPFIDPPGSNDDQYVEKSLRLPRTFWCIDPGMMNPVAVNPLPALSSGQLTFGCLNRFSKVSPAALEAWIEILRGIPQARLVAYARSGRYLDDVKSKFQDRGIDPERVRFVGRTSEAGEYLRRYHEIDIALDPFPCGGGVTSIDALWMGVPLITLRGKTAVGRSGVSILSNMGLDDWIAQDVGQYVKIAIEKARELAHLGELRARLRETISKSPLMDSAAFARDMEGAFRTMWKAFATGG
jgi:protein O-GlcNAc transferase